MVCEYRLVNTSIDHNTFFEYILNIIMIVAREMHKLVNIIIRMHMSCVFVCVRSRYRLSNVTARELTQTHRLSVAAVIDR